MSIELSPPESSNKVREQISPLSAYKQASWHAKIGGFLGGFRVGKKRAVQLANPATLSISEGSLRFQSRYNPPGSGWYALLASLVTLPAVFLLAQVFGFAAGPGWLVWYIIFRLARRKEVSIALNDAESAVVDRENQRLAFRTEFLGRSRWIAFEIPNDFEYAAKTTELVLEKRCAAGRITRPSMLPAYILLGVILLVVAWIVYFAVTGMQ